MSSEYKPNFGTVSLTAAVTIRPDAHAGVPLILNLAGGFTVTLPAATGSGATYEFWVGTTTTTGYVIQVTGNDIMQGVAWATQDSADTVVAFETAADSDTLTLNGTTKGGYIGDHVKLIDAKADTWLVQSWAKATGTEASPFSAAVS